jgi:hypothetical protein
VRLGAQHLAKAAQRAPSAAAIEPRPPALQPASSPSSQASGFQLFFDFFCHFPNFLY